LAAIAALIRARGKLAQESQGGVVFLLIRCALAGFSWVALGWGAAFSLDWLAVGAAPWGGALVGGIALSGCGGLVLAVLGGENWGWGFGD
jgi:hypothetical protein